MDKKEKIIRTNPQFIRLRDGSLMNINNIVAISEADSKVFVLGYQRIPITEEDMAAVLGNIEIIDDDGHQHHCGLDAANSEEQIQSMMDLIGMEVVAICGSKTKCEGCSRTDMDCVKVELFGGGFLCLAKPQQDERPVISFDEDEQQQEEATRTIMDGIREQTQAFLDYLDNVVKG